MRTRTIAVRLSSAISSMMMAQTSRIRRNRPTHLPLVTRLTERMLAGKRWVEDQGSAVAVAGLGKACGHVVAQQGEVGGVRAVADRQGAAGARLVRGVAECGRAAEDDIRKVDFVLPAEARDGAVELG